MMPMPTEHQPGHPADLAVLSSNSDAAQRAKVCAHLLVYRQHLLLLLLLLLLGRLDGSHCMRLCLQLLRRCLRSTVSMRAECPSRHGRGLGCRSN